MPKEQINITIRPDVLSHVDTRASAPDGGREGGRSGIISRDLARYYEALAYARKDLRELLSVEEISLILDALNGCAHADTVSIRLVWAEVSDAISLDGLDTKWKVDGKKLVKTLRGLDYAHNCALVDAVERWWNSVGAGQQPDYAEALA